MMDRRPSKRRTFTALDEDSSPLLPPDDDPPEILDRQEQRRQVENLVKLAEDAANTHDIAVGVIEAVLILVLFSSNVPISRLASVPFLYLSLVRRLIVFETPTSSVRPRLVDPRRTARNSVDSQKGEIDDGVEKPEPVGVPRVLASRTLFSLAVLVVPLVYTLSVLFSSFITDGVNYDGTAPGSGISTDEALSSSRSTWTPSTPSKVLWSLVPTGFLALSLLVEWEGDKAVREARALQGLMYDAPEA
ncbi:hypothetical protein JCM10212_005479 [Sporobolomyces blumeae]